MKTLTFQDGNYLQVCDDGHYDIVAQGMGLYQCFPALDGAPIEPKTVEVKAGKGRVTVTYATANFDLLVTFQDKGTHLAIGSWLRNLRGCREIVSLSLFEGAHLSGYEKVLAHGYFSWDQSALISGANLQTAESHGVTAVLGPTANLVLGFLRHDRMMQYFTYAAAGNQSFVSAEAVLEGKDLRGVQEVEFSELVVFSDGNLHEGQKKWARLAAAENAIKLTQPPVRGWCSWYYNYFWFSGELLEEYLRKFRPYKDELNLNVFVIDANYFAHLGDWLETNEKFPKGLEYYAQKITEAGYVPGIWIGPYMVSDRSKLFREHPEWLCRDEKGELIEFMSPLGEDNVWGYRDKIHYCLDTSHPEAFAYLRQVIGTLRRWGYRYFKTDFMYWGAMDRFEGGWYHEGLNRHNFIADPAKRPKIKRSRPGKTRVEYFIDVAKMIRREAGPESIILGCGEPIWMSIGCVDCIRISRDVGARWVAHNSPQQLLNDLALRNFTNGVFYQVDPDCVLLRHFEHKLTDDEVTSLALYMGVSQGMVLTSDPVHECRRDRRELFKFIQAGPGIEFAPALLGREEQLIAYVGRRRDSDLRVVFCFNPSETPVERTLPLAALGLAEKSHVCEWKKERRTAVLEGALSVQLAPHQSKLWFVRTKPFEKGFKPAHISG